jgi:RibD domain-containing protein
MRRLLMWNMITLDGYFEGSKSWDIGWHEVGWGEELKQLSIEQTSAGSANLSASLTRKGLIDEYRLGLNPIALGAGTPLFKPGPEGMKLKLLEARALKTGCVLLRYEPMRAAGR